MSTNHPTLFEALNAEFPRDQVKTRSGGGGRQLSYITERMASIRLDEVVGPECWRSRYRVERLAGDVDSVVCTLEIKVDGEWIAKEGAGGFKEMTEKNRAGEMVEDEENTAKTGFSDSFKRAASAWGVGRYLYRDGAPRFVKAPVPAKAPPPASARPSPAPLKPTNPPRPDRPALHAPASFDEVVALDRALDDFANLMNARWLDRHTSDGGEVREGVGDLIGPVERKRLMGRLLVFGLRAGLLPDAGIPFDKATGKPLGRVEPGKVKGLVASLFARHPDEVTAEAEEFTRELAAAADKALDAEKHSGSESRRGDVHLEEAMSN